MTTSKELADNLYKLAKTGYSMADLESLTSLEKGLINILDSVAYGIENAISSNFVSKSLGISTRDLRLLKRHMVLIHHKPIGSNVRGYWYAANDHELMKMVRSYETRIMKYSVMMKAYRGMIVYKGQEEMF